MGSRRLDTACAALQEKRARKRLRRKHLPSNRLPFTLPDILSAGSSHISLPAYPMALSNRRLRRVPADTSSSERRLAIRRIGSRNSCFHHGEGRFCDANRCFRSAELSFHIKTHTSRRTAEC